MMQREEEKYYEEARRFAWDYFDLHSKHRLEMFKSYVTFVGLILFCLEFFGRCAVSDILSV